MKSHKLKLTTLTILTLLTLGMFSSIPMAFAAPTLVKVCPSFIELGNGGANVVGTDVLVGVCVQDVSDLYGFDIRLQWDTEYFAYLNHTITVPWNATPTPVPPCGLPGLLYAPVIESYFDLNILEGKIAIAWASRAPAPSFFGSGTAYYIWFRLIKQPYDYEGDVTTSFTLYLIKLADKGGAMIPYEKQDATVIIHTRPFVYPPLPLLDVRCDGTKSFTADKINQEFQVNIWLLGGSDLDPFWDVQGFDMYLNFDKNLVEAINSTIDPAGQWLGFWPGGVHIVINEINNAEGYVRMVFLGLPGGVPPGHTPPYGVVHLASLWFKAIYESDTYPPPSFTFTLENPPDKKPEPIYWPPENFLVKIAGAPHPERPMAPWFGLPWAPSIPHIVSGAQYTAPFKPPGRWIDLYLWGIEACNGTRWEYGDQFKGFGPNVPADAVQPQAKVILKALVTYNLNPVQSKTVVFEIEHGEFHFIRSAITDKNGIATIIITIPWPCDDPEGRVFGDWFITATVDIVKVVINDTLTFEVGYLINIVSVTPLKDVYKIGEHMGFKITYDCISEQPRNVVFTIVVYDDLGVAIAYKMVPVTGVTKGTGYEIILDCMTVPKWAFVGRGTVYANALEDLPSCGGAAYCPERSNTFGLAV
jgi:hypothetical protein